MKKYLILSAACLVLAGCKGPLAGDRIWPDGASVHIGEFTIQASMSGAGSVVMRDVSWTGTNGFPIPGTNSAPTSVLRQ